jgi:hypothetical protein
MPLPASAFVNPELQTRDIEMPDGSVHPFYFRELPSIDFRRFQMAESSLDDDKRALSMAQLFVRAISDPDGNPAMTIEEAVKLKMVVANRFMSAILEVNGFGKKKGTDQETL